MNIPVLSRSEEASALRISTFPRQLLLVKRRGRPRNHEWDHYLPTPAAQPHSHPRIFSRYVFFVAFFFLAGCERRRTSGPPSQSAAFLFLRLPLTLPRLPSSRRTTYGTSVQHPSRRKTELLRRGPKPNAQRIRAPSLVIASEQLELGSNSPGVALPLLFHKKIASVVVRYRELKTEQCLVELRAKKQEFL